jgi:hypothetical protein
MVTAKKLTPTPKSAAASPAIGTKAPATKAPTAKAPVAKAETLQVAPQPTTFKAGPVAKSLATATLVVSVKPKRTKLVRDGFTIPKPEYLVLEELKLRATSLKTPTKKSELIRAGIKALAAMPDKGFLAALGAVPSIKTGRPVKG